MRQCVRSKTRNGRWRRVVPAIATAAPTTSTTATAAAFARCPVATFLAVATSSATALATLTFGGTIALGRLDRLAGNQCGCRLDRSGLSINFRRTRLALATPFSRSARVAWLAAFTAATTLARCTFGTLALGAAF